MKDHAHEEWLADILRPMGRSDAAIAALRQADAALFQYRRRAAKSDFARTIIERLKLGMEPAQFHGLTAIAQMQLGFGGVRIREATIGDLAEELAIDPSRASRIAGYLIRRGFVRREASQGDGRKSILVLSQAGRATMTAVGTLKWRMLARGLADWTEEEIITFSRLFPRYADALAGLSGQEPEVAESEAGQIARALSDELAARGGD